MVRQPPPDLERRAFLGGALGAGAWLLGCGRNPLDEVVAAADEPGWRSGPIAHLLPTADHTRIRLKVSSVRPLEQPRLRVGAYEVVGRAGDSAGRFHSFDVSGLEPATRYTLSLHEAGERLCDPWPLRTFPAPGDDPERLRLLVYTCAGGPDDLYNFGFFDAYLPIPLRRRLLARALSFAPDAAVANGDHVYWDMLSRFGLFMGRSPVAWWNAGLFDRSQPILGSANEAVLQRAFGPQIAGLYGGLLRSTPTHFLQDDHDYGENDEASDALRTFPPDPFMLDLARTTQRLYYPELLPPPGLPEHYLEAPGISPHFGALRFGRLFEAWLYDCRRFLTNETDGQLGHTDSRFVPEDVEAWLIQSTRTSPCLYAAHMPSTPMLWTAGKWGEWYPDAKNPEGELRADGSKPYWAQGWAEQHDRLLRALAGPGGDSGRKPLVISGDLHATALGRIHASRGRGLGGQPVVSLLSGAVGTGALGFPSKFRAQRPLPSGTLEAEEIVAPVEENGFSLLDITSDSIRVSMFRWLPSRDPAEIDSLEPFRVVDLPRSGAGA